MGDVRGLRAAAAGEPLAHLLAVIRTAVDLLDEAGLDVDARILEAHRAQLGRGREWPGDAVAPAVLPDGSTT